MTVDKDGRLSRAMVLGFALGMCSSPGVQVTMRMIYLHTAKEL